MPKFTIEATLEVDELLYDNSDYEEREWFYHLLVNNEHILHNNEPVGDFVGTIKITSFKPVQ